jgi:hypothetical protein
LKQGLGSRISKEFIHFPNTLSAVLLTSLAMMIIYCRGTTRITLHTF